MKEDDPMSIKKIVIGTLLLSTILLGACSSDEPNDRSGSSSTTSQTSGSPSSPTTNDETGVASRTLVAYYSVPETDGTDADTSASRVVHDGEVIGTTEQIATWISEASGANVFEINTVDAYPGNHDDLVDQAEIELDDDYRPALSSQIENLDDYDTIFIGYPIWFSDLPTPMYTFFEETDFSNKTIIPFSTHGGSNFSGTLETIAQLEPEAIIESDNGLAISRSSANSQQTVNDWVSELGYN